MTLSQHLARVAYAGDRYDRNRQTGPQAVFLNADLIEKSRHSLKVFDDTERGFEGVVALFEDEIMPAHSALFLNNTPFRWARRLETDLGLYRCGKRLVSTTHVLNFQVAFPAALLQDEVGLSELLKSLGYDYGKYFSAFLEDEALDALLENPPGNKFADQRFAQQDVLASRYYQRQFDTSLPQGVTSVLTSVQCSLNAADVLLPVPGDHESSVLRARFITLHHAFASLQHVTKRYAATMSNASNRRLQELFDHPTTRLVVEAPNDFRNTLMHYGIRQVDPAQLSPAEPMAGLAEVFFPGVGFDELNRLVGEHTAHVANELNDWATKRKPKKKRSLQT